MASLETININIRIKLDCLTNLANIIKTKNTTSAAKLNKAINTLEYTYIHGSVHILTEYNECIRGSNAQTHIVPKLCQQLIKFVSNENIVSLLKIYYDMCKSQIELYNLRTDKSVIHYCKLYENTILHIAYTDLTNNLCPYHGIVMTTEMYTNEITCKVCGYSEKRIAESYGDESTPDAQKPKNSRYVDVKHCDQWLLRIEGREVANLSEEHECVKAVKKCIIRDKIIYTHISYDLIRTYTEETGYRDYYNNVVQIHKIITKIIPQQFTDNERKLIIYYFGLVSDAFRKDKQTSKPNNLYNPYFIYKIIEQVVPDVKRRNTFLYAIHLQSDKTLCKNDKEWEKICVIIPEFTYIATIKKIK